MTTLAEYMRTAEREYVLQTLAACHWNVSRAAVQAGCTRDWLYRLMQRHQIVRPPGTRKVYGGNEAWRALR